MGSFAKRLEALEKGSAVFRPFSMVKAYPGDDADAVAAAHRASSGLPTDYPVLLVSIVSPCAA